MVNLEHRLNKTTGRKGELRPRYHSITVPNLLSPPVMMPFRSHPQRNTLNPRPALAQAQAQISELTDDSQPLQKRLSKVQGDNGNLKQSVTELTDQTGKLKAELEHLRTISADAITIDGNNQKLIAKNQVLQNNIDILRAENERLSDKSDMEWFLNGVFAVAFGVFLTLIIPRIRPTKKHSEWT
jgi:SH3 domain protein